MRRRSSGDARSRGEDRTKGRARRNDDDPRDAALVRQVLRSTNRCRKRVFDGNRAPAVTSGEAAVASTRTGRLRRACDRLLRPGVRHGTPSRHRGTVIRCVVSGGAWVGARSASSRCPSWRRVSRAVRNSRSLTRSTVQPMLAVFPLGRCQRLSGVQSSDTRRAGYTRNSPASSRLDIFERAPTGSRSCRWAREPSLLR